MNADVKRRCDNEGDLIPLVASVANLNPRGLALRALLVCVTGSLFSSCTFPSNPVALSAANFQQNAGALGVQEKTVHNGVSLHQDAAPSFSPPLTLHTEAAPEEPAPLVNSYKQVGLASYYHHSLQGQPTASGERYSTNKFTAAHKSLPFGSKLRVTNQKNGQSVIVTVNDRGPWIKGRIIDISNCAARAIGLERSGVTSVRVELISRGAAS